MQNFGSIYDTLTVIFLLLLFNTDVLLLLLIYHAVQDFVLTFILIAIENAPIKYVPTYKYIIYLHIILCQKYVF